MIRTLHSELVDNLPPDHPGAVETRRDLRRINAIMGHVGILARELRAAVSRKISTPRLVEIGAGDGAVLLRVAQRLRANWREVDATFIDLQDLLASKTKAEFAALDWQVRAVKDDVFEWFDNTASETADAILANLVLHHFHDHQLRELFSASAIKTDVFIALEPHRSVWPLFCTHWLPLIGCGAVACHDAPVSVRAGFVGRELSALWPQDGNWELIERRAGLFSHLFVARRKV